MPTNADVVALQMERVRPKLQEMFENFTAVSSMVRRGAETENISTRDYRLPAIFANGGDFRTYDPDGGDMGLGSGPIADVMISSYFPVVLAFQLTNLQMMATATAERSVAKVFARTMSAAIKEMQVYDDLQFHTGGDGVFAQATATTTASSKQVYTLDTAFSTQRCRRNMKCKVYATNLSGAKGTSGDATYAFRIGAIDPAAGTVTLDGLVNSAASTDKLLFDGVGVGATPPWKKGLYYHVSNASTGNYLSLDRAKYPELVSSSVNAAGALAPIHGLNLLDQMVQRWDDTGKIQGIAHQKQRTANYLLGIQISEFSRGKSDEMIDLVPGVGNGTKSFKFCGVDHIVDKRQDRSRIDWVDFSKFGRAILADLDYHTVEGRKLFEMRGASTGVAAGMLFYLRQLEDWYLTEPGKTGYIYGLTAPA